MAVLTELTHSFLLQKKNVSTHQALEYLQCLSQTHDKLLLINAVCREYGTDPYSAFYFHTRYRTGKPYRLVDNKEAFLFFDRLFKETQPLVSVSNKNHEFQLLFDYCGQDAFKLGEYRHNSPPEGKFSGISGVIVGISSELRHWDMHPIEKQEQLERLKQQVNMTRITAAQARSAEAVARMQEAGAALVEAEAKHRMKRLEAETLQIEYRIDAHEDEAAGDEAALLKPVSAFGPSGEGDISIGEDMQKALPAFAATGGALKPQVNRMYYSQIEALHNVSTEVQARLDRKA